MLYLRIKKKKKEIKDIIKNFETQKTSAVELNKALIVDNSNNLSNGYWKQLQK